MAKKAATRRRTKETDLTRLTQAEAAWLVDKPAVWLRDNARLDGRNSDGTYDGKRLVRALRTDFQPVELSNQDFEFSLGIAETIADCHGTSVAGLANVLRGIGQRHGAAGLAAFAKVVLETADEWSQLYDLDDRHTPTEQDIRDEAEAKIEDLKHLEAGRQLKSLGQCPTCKRYRYCRDWIDALPKGYAPQTGVDCPECEAELSKPRKRTTAAEVLGQLDGP